MSASLSQLISSRGNYRGQVNRLYDDRSTFHQKTVEEKEVLKAKLKRLQNELDKLDPRIRDLKWIENSKDEEKAKQENTKEIAESTTYGDKLDYCYATLSQVAAEPSFNGHHSLQSMLKSATAPLPKFSSGEDEDLMKFLEQFEETTRRFNYSDYDKFLLLKQQVGGRAHSLLSSLDCAQHSYAEAKTILVDALASPTIRKFKIIKQLTSLKLEYQSEPFEYIGKIKSIEKAISNLKIETDDFLQYFAWVGMNESFKSQLIQITNESKPGLTLIKEKFFEACGRYLEIQKHYKSRKKGADIIEKNATCLATKVDFGKNVFKDCPLCDKIPSHPINQCQLYFTPKSKIDRLVSLKACTKCGRTDHEARSCKFHFNRKCSCGEWHFKFLCTQEDSSKRAEVESSKKQEKPLEKKKLGIHSNTHAGFGCVEEFSEVFKISGCSRAILPTFSCTLNNGDSIRCMRDGGSQSNFILEKKAKEENLEVIKSDVKLHVHGFNSSQVYLTNIYQVNLNIGGISYSIKAMGVPSIRINMDLPGLDDVAKEFIQKGYYLADKFLLGGGDSIECIDFILGSNSAYCLKEKQITFGGLDCEPSIYSLTPAGVMLLGNIDQFKTNLKHLPLNVDNVVQAQSSNFNIGLDETKLVSCEDLRLTSTSLSCIPDEFLQTGVNTNYAVLSEKGEVVQSELQKATEEMLEQICDNALMQEKEIFPESSIESNENIVNHVLRNTTQMEDGRLKMPLIWNSKVDHLLGKNRNLATQILKSNFKKLSKGNGEYLYMVNKNFKEQEELGMIERIEDVDQFVQENPNHSFLAHMAIFKPERLTTKCRVVFLSNLCERDQSQRITLTHNQAMLSGPTLNQKITTALLHMRFDHKLLCFDVKKAFLNICLSTVDANKLLFLWYRNVEKEDYTYIAYRSVRLPFGLVCSPCLLMLGLYKILIIDIEKDSEDIKILKRLIYALIYMDNGGITTNSTEQLEWAFNQLKGIFEPYQFLLQQFVTNDQNLQGKIDDGSEEKTEEQVKLLGLQWNRVKDTLSTRPLCLNSKANTKRTILQSIASHYDIYGFTGPILNRARLFLHSLQCDSSVSWDKVLSNDQLKEWKNICAQANSSPEISVERFVGTRDGKYRLIAFTDSSKDIYGTVIYIQDTDSNRISFLMAKNRLVNKKLTSKGMPSLEFQAIVLGTETLIDLYKELAGQSCVVPINVVDLILYSDSMVSLAWINSHVHKLEKWNKRSIFVLNRLEYIDRICTQHPVTFKFVSGIENPADKITRAISYKCLNKSNYFVGPDFLRNQESGPTGTDEILNIVVPNPLAKSLDVEENLCLQTHRSVPVSDGRHLVCMDKCSDFHRLVSVHRCVLRFIHILKQRLFVKNPQKYSHLKPSKQNLFALAGVNILKTEQRICFPEIFTYFEKKEKTVKDMPNLISQLNIYLDKEGLLRVKSKFSRRGKDEDVRFPILLPKNSNLTRLIILDLHVRTSHSGCYALLAELRKQYWVPRYFSSVKAILKSCVICKKLNQRSIKLNQSPYRDFRMNPPSVPYRYIFVDHLGPFYIKHNKQKVKAWLLCITCLWSRAVNLKICLDLSTAEFLRALQLHCFQYGIPELCLSDLGSSIVAGANIITDFIKDSETQAYFDEQGIKSPCFQQYFKGCHSLGGLVEICVKMVKKLIHCTIRNNVLNYRDFEYIVEKTVHLINKRPVAFIEGLRDNNEGVIPDPITPEKLIHGLDLPSMNIIPKLQPDPEIDPDWLVNDNPVSVIQKEFEKLRSVNAALISTYNSEFLNQLTKQAVNKKSRYKAVTHTPLAIGDIVLIREENCKPFNYPMAIVKDIIVNENGEVTNAIVMKGKTRELTKRHATTLIPILSEKEVKPMEPVMETKHHQENTSKEKSLPIRRKRIAAIKGEKVTRSMLQN